MSCSSAARPVAGPLDAVEQSAAARFGDRYAGVGVINGQQAVLVAGQAAGDPKEVDGRPVRYVTYSLARLQQAQAAIDGVVADLEANGHQVFQWQVDVATNSVVVAVGDPEADGRAVKAALGADGPYRFVTGSRATPS